MFHFNWFLPYLFIGSALKKERDLFVFFFCLFLCPLLCLYFSPSSPQTFYLKCCWKAPVQRWSRVRISSVVWDDIESGLRKGKLIWDQCWGGISQDLLFLLLPLYFFHWCNRTVWMGKFLWFRRVTGLCHRYSLYRLTKLSRYDIYIEKELR